MRRRWRRRRRKRMLRLMKKQATYHQRKIHARSSVGHPLHRRCCNWSQSHCHRHCWNVPGRECDVHGDDGVEMKIEMRRMNEMATMGRNLTCTHCSYRHQWHGREHVSHPTKHCCRCCCCPHPGHCADCTNLRVRSTSTSMNRAMMRIVVLGAQRALAVQFVSIWMRERG